ncbi:MAG: hypothetical protein HYZ48_03340 [Chlamydiales bacterium]|nr:hypothetical protein [Chlamydiales bacterium]
MRSLLLLLLLAISPLWGATENPHLKTLRSALDPLSVSEHLAFYELYPNSPEGKAALTKAWELLGGEKIPAHLSFMMLPHFDLQGIISLVNRGPSDPSVSLTEEQLEKIRHLGKNLGNRKLQGHTLLSKEELLNTPSEEIDLGRALLIEQFQNSEKSLQEIYQYEAHLDLMALQILARLPQNPTDEEKIARINHFLFHEMQFRFPPHAVYAKDIDLYTFLPSVIDGRQGVCLGVSILYLCLAQRIDLPLEIITPPGHIYIRYHNGEKTINIETTARGIDLPSSVYLSVNTHTLKKRTLKEVIGMSFVNQASVSWSKADYQTTLDLYERARPYMPNDPLLTMFLGFQYLFTGQNQKGASLLKKIEKITFEDSTSQETIPEDYLAKKVDAEGIKAVFASIDETRESIIEKQKEIQQILKKFPLYRAGLFHLAITWLQLGRGLEALDTLERYHKIDPNNPTVEYYIALIAAQRFDFPKAWSHLKLAETLLSRYDHNPKAISSFRDNLRRLCPEP